MKISILTPGLTTSNGAAFLFPLLAWRPQIKNAGLDIKIVNSISKIQPSEIIILDSKFHKYFWKIKPDLIFQDLFFLKKSSNKLIYCDTTDSTGSLQSELLEYVDLYWKSQLLKDRKKYRKKMYGHRIFTDYYHRKFNVIDENAEYSNNVKNDKNLKKLRVSWNSAFADYSLLGPIKTSLFSKIHFSNFLSFPEKKFTSPSKNRMNDISCRFGVSYERDTVAFQRNLIRELSKEKFQTSKLNRLQYYRELKQSKVIISPFGLGEITLKDFEVFLTGGLLIKPSMLHLETWPKLYQEDNTFKSFSWNLSDFSEVIIDAIKYYDESIELAFNGQKQYRKYISNVTGPELFFNHLEKIL